jgi:iron complex outermembrane recepter protein
MKRILLLLLFAIAITSNRSFAFTGSNRNLLLNVNIFPPHHILLSEPDTIIGNVRYTCTLKGKILNKQTGETIPGAVVLIPDLKKVTLSDLNGNYHFENLPNISLMVKVTYLGFKTILENIDFSITTIQDFKLEPSITEINEVVITGTSRSAEINRSPIPIMVIDRKSIDQILTTNIIDAIAKQPGINAVTTEPNVSKPFIHGMGYNRVLTRV